jgi:hypothetical protein
MNHLRTVDLSEIMAQAASALSGASGHVVKIDAMQPLSNDDRRNFVGRARAIDDSGRVRSILVKATRSQNYDPAAENALASGLVREWVATAYLAARAPGRGHGAALLAGDVSRGLLIFEDLGRDLSSLVDPLLNGTAEEAERALSLYAVVLGRLHADTADCLASHHDTFQSIFGQAGRCGLRVGAWRRKPMSSRAGSAERRRPANWNCSRLGFVIQVPGNLSCMVIHARTMR